MMCFKKGFIILSLLCSLSGLYAITVVGSNSTTLILSPSAADMYEIGFSTGIVYALNQTVQTIADNNYSLIVPADASIGEDNGNIYAYWKIISSMKLYLYVDVSSPLTGPSGKLGFKLAVSDKSIEISEEGVKKGNYSDENYSDDFGMLIYTYSGRPSSGIGEAGSVKFEIQTDNFSSKPAGTYVAQIKLSLVSQ